MKDEMFVKCILSRSFLGWIMLGVFSLSRCQKCEWSRELCMYGWQQILKDDLSYRPRRRLGPLGDVLLWTSVPVCLLGIRIAEEFNTVFLFLFGFLELKTETTTFHLQPPQAARNLFAPICFVFGGEWRSFEVMKQSPENMRRRATALVMSHHVFFFAGDWGSVMSVESPLSSTVTCL